MLKDRYQIPFPQTLEHSPKKPLYLYNISKKKEAQSDLYEKIIAKFRRNGYLNTRNNTIYVENDIIYFAHNLKEIYAMLGSFADDILDFGRYDVKLASCSYGMGIKKIPPIGFNEYWLFEQGFIRNDCGIVIERCQPGSILSRQEAYIQAMLESPCHQDSEDLEDKKIKIGNHGPIGKVLINKLEDGNGLSLGELHNQRSPKKLLIFSMPELTKCGVKHLYIEFGFYDTQNKLYEEFHNSGNLSPILLNYLVQEDKLNGLILFDKESLFHSYRDNPYTHLGIIIMAKMHGIKITPIDHTEAFDSVRRYLTQGIDHFGTKRTLLMNQQSVNIVSSQHREDNEKYIIFTGECHNITHSEYKNPSIPRLLNIPYLQVGEYNGLINECDLYTKALLIHNIHRVLFGKPVKVFASPKNLSCEIDLSTLLQLIFLQDLKSDVDDSEWNTAAKSKFDFFPFRWVPSNINKLRKELLGLEEIKGTQEINQKFYAVGNILGSRPEAADTNFFGERLKHTREFYLDKFLNLMDLVDSSFRKTYCIETFPAVFNISDAADSDHTNSPLMNRTT